jgi:F-type H+-transporting ATPase subunit delta
MIARSAMKRYAQALFESAVEQEILDVVTKDIDLLGECFAPSGDITHLLSLPSLSVKSRTDCLRIALDEKIDKLTLQFMFLLTSHGRLAHASIAFDEFRKLVDTQTGRVNVYVSSARPMDEGSHRLLIQKMQKRTGRRVHINYTVDPRLLGGFVITYENTMLDCSTAGAISQFRESLFKSVAQFMTTK